VRALPSADRPLLEGGLSTAFGCTLEGDVPVERVVRLGAALMEAGCDEVGLADTTGYANPAQIKTVIRAVRASTGAQAVASLHLHNTRGLGLANVLAGLDEGITTFDASLGGLGGCPFAPGASGNIVTEDLVFMLQAMGFETGIDLPRLLAVRKILAAALPQEPLYGFAADAGLPLGFAAPAERGT
jgi:hydroxymethylglutaryl-CoA lyase